VSLLFQVLVPYAIVTFRSCPMSLLECLSFRGSSYNTVLGMLFPSALLNRQSFMTVSLTLCRKGTVGHLSVGGCQLLPGCINTLAPFLRLLAVPYS
jgi:hypothetical protein